MKVQIYASAIVNACDKAIAYIKPFADEEAARVKAERDRKIPWWEMFSMVPTRCPVPVIFSAKLTDIIHLRAIAKHKRPETLIEMTAEELAPIATYLSEFESERI